jgi:hypothetical protein
MRQQKDGINVSGVRLYTIFTEDLGPQRIAALTRFLKTIYRRLPNRIEKSFSEFHQALETSVERKV